MNQPEKVTLGAVSVDSGQLLLVDPCYLKYWDHGEPDFNSPEILNSYDEVCKKTSGKDGGGEVFDNLAVAFSTGFGDGVYSVHGIKEGGRILLVWVEMGIELEDYRDLL